MLEDANLVDEDIEESVSNKSWGTRIVVDGETFATSLFWQPLQSKEDPYAEVGEAAEGILEGADLFCIKSGKSPQFGICVSGEGYKAGENAAAVTLATALGNLSSFVAVFKLEEGWWYTCIRNDIILSDGDMLFLNEEDAKNQLLSMLAVPDWGKKIAPPEWQIEEAEYPDLAKLFQRGARAKLQKIKALRGPKLIAVVGISAVVGLWLFSSIINALFLTPAKKPIIAPVAPKVKQVEKPPEIKPWEKIREPEVIFEECYKRVSDLVTIMTPGWIIEKISCNQDGAASSWKREFGRIAWMSKALDESGVKFKSRSVSDDGSIYSASIALNQEAKVITSPPLVSTSDLRKTLNDLAQSIGVNINMSNLSVVSPEKNTYRSVKFMIQSTQNPLMWSDLLTKFSGLEVSIIRYDTKNEMWEYEGAIYVL